MFGSLPLSSKHRRMQMFPGLFTTKVPVEWFKSYLRNQLVRLDMTMSSCKSIDGLNHLRLCPSVTAKKSKKIF